MSGNNNRGGSNQNRNPRQGLYPQLSSVDYAGESSDNNQRSAVRAPASYEDDDRVSNQI